MIYIFLSIFCSVVVSILLKLAKRYEISVPQAIVWNYLAAALLAFFIYKPVVSQITFSQAPLNYYLLLGILLPLLFVVLGLSIRYTGIVRTDLAQRLSLFIPLLAAFLIYKEPVSAVKGAGIAVGFIAIICSIPWQKQSLKSKGAILTWLYPLIVFIGMGIIDISFKHIAAFKSVSYTSSLFIVFLIAFSLSLLALVIGMLTGRMKFSIVNLLCGLLLGLFNFFNILFYLKAHRALSENPSVVFSAMNIGVIAVGSLIGIVVFKEKLSKLNKLGIVLAMIAIILIAIVG